MPTKSYIGENSDHLPPSPIASPGAVSASLAVSVAGALAAPLAVVAFAHYGAVFVLLALALFVFQVDAVAVRGARLDLAGQAGSARLPLSEVLGTPIFL